MLRHLGNHRLMLIALPFNYLSLSVETQGSWKALKLSF